MADRMAGVSDALQERYAIERELGRGGMATVYLARDLRHDRPVALKLLHSDLGAALGPERFQREIAIAARLSHPHILALYDSGEADGRLYYVMPYVAGESLRQRLEREGSLSVAEAVRIIRAVAAALDCAHEQGVAHRDIKPENILLEGERVLVADFGIAKALDGAGERLTQTGLSLGTPAYMSPEQAAAGGRLDRRSDIYALGCVAYELLAGAPPFTGPSAQAILARHAVDPVPPLRTVRPGVLEAVAGAIERALAKVPADRYATAGEFAEALNKAMTAPGTHRVRPRRLAHALLAVGAGALATGATVAGWRLTRAHSIPGVEAAAASMAVLPLVAPPGDTALSRLGRDLAITVSASLDGIGEVQTADRLTLHRVTAGQPVSSPAQAAEVARRLSAGSALLGTLVGDGVNARVDLGLYDSRTLAPLAQAITTTAHRDSLGALTDSITWAVLRQIWRRGAPPTPSLAALTTGSLPALRSFLEGERHTEQGWWESAALAYRSAIASDSTFWLAYFRYAQARYWIHQEVEPEFLEAFRRHRSEFPERERLLLESSLEPSESRTLELLEQLTKRFPDYWPGWFRLGDALYHVGPLMGHTWKDSHRALRRAVALNPGLQPGWHHLFINSLGRDVTEGAPTYEWLREVWELDPLADSAQAVADLRHARLMAALDRSDGVIEPGDSALADSVAQFSISPQASEFHRGVAPVSLLWVGNPAGQVAFNRRVVRAATDPTAAAPALAFMGWAWAERGAWDSALAAMHEGAARRPHPIALGEYSLAVLGSWLGVISSADALARRPAAVRMIARLEDPARRTELLGALAWLDGMAAYSAGNGMGIVRARRDARRSGHPHADLIDRSLRAFGQALSGDRAAAARALSALERECAESAWLTCGEPRTPNIAAHRLAAATWLLETGDTVEAARLLTWHEARFAAWQWSFVVAPLAYLLQARIEESLGDAATARAHYRQFLRRYDSPMTSQRHLVDEARKALARLQGK